MAPWPIGGNWPFARTVFLVLSLLSLASACWFLAKQWSPSGQTSNTESRLSRLPIIWLVVAVGVGFSAFQASAYSSFLSVENASSTLGEIQTREINGLSTQQRPISVSPAATRSRMVDLSLGIAFFFAATVLLADRTRLKLTFHCLAIVGVALSFFGILQGLSYNSKIFWHYELLGGGVPFGSFVNSNNAAGFLLITFSAGAFFLGYQLFQWAEPSTKNKSDDSLWGHPHQEKNLVGRVLSVIVRTQAKHLYCLAALSLIITGVISTVSRGGMFALVVAATTCLVLLAIGTRRLAGLLVALVVAACGIGLVAYTGKSDRIMKELETFTNVGEIQSIRLRHWNDAIPFATEHLGLGTGNGTYRIVSPIFQSFYSPRIFAHAESVYVETLVDMGIVGVALLLICIVYCAYCSIVLLRRFDVFDRAVGLAGATCLAGQLVAMAFDFGIYQPANTIAMATVMGAVVGRACVAPAREPASHRIKETTRVTRGFLFASLLATALLNIWATYESLGVESVRAAKRTLRLIDKYESEGKHRFGGVTIDNVQEHLRWASSIRPDDPNLHIYLGEAEILTYRTAQLEKTEQEVKQQLEHLRSMRSGLSDKTVAPETASNPRESIEAEMLRLQELSPDELWQSTLLSAAHRQVNLARRNDPELVSRIKNEPAVEHLRLAFRHFVDADSACSLLSKVQLRLAQLAVFNGQSAEQESQYVEKALRISSRNTQLIFSCAILALSTGEQDQAVRLIKTCLENPHLLKHEKVLIELCQSEMPMRLMFEHVLPQNPQDLNSLNEKYFNTSELLLPRQLLAAHTKRLIEQFGTTEDDSEKLKRCLWLAKANLLSANYSASVASYEQAKAFVGPQSEVEFTFDYAYALFKNRQFDDAVKQLKISQLKMSAPLPKIRSLLKKIRKSRSNSPRIEQNNLSTTTK
jgi:O-antigen ligase